MPNGGQFSAGSGIRLQATTPGATDNGNENISGRIIASYATFPGAARAKTGDVTPDVNVSIGDGQIWKQNLNVGPNQSIAIGNETEVGQLAINNLDTGMIAIGQGAKAKARYAIAIGAGSAVGVEDGGGQSCGLAIGRGSQVINWYGQSSGDAVVIGTNNISTHVPFGGFYAGEPIMIGSNLRHYISTNGAGGWGAGGYGFCTLIGNAINCTEGYNILYIDTMLPNAKNVTAADNNTIFLGNQFHTSAVVMGKKYIGFGGNIFSQTANTTLANSIAETSIIGSGVGSTTIPADTLKAGNCINISARGVIADTLTPTLRVKIKIGATVYLDTAAIPLTALAGTHGWALDATITIRTVGAGGTALGNGQMYISVGAFIDLDTLNTAPIAIDTTVANTVDVTFQWGTANALNTETTTNLQIEVK